MTCAEGNVDVVSSAHRAEGVGPPYGRVWWIVFVYALVAGIFVQFVVVPYMFPAMQAGNGILAGMDSVAYHALAVELAERIRSDGWANWELRPQGHFSVGMATAIYAITVSKPWVVLPFNAAMHALSAIVLLRIFVLISPNWKWALIATLPFAFLPSAANWYTQLLKDGYFFLGVLLFACGWVILSQRATWNDDWRRPTIGILLATIGFLIVGFVRPIMMSLFLASAVLLLLVQIVFLSTHALRHVVPYGKAMKAVCTSGILVVILIGLKTYAVQLKPVEEAYTQVEPSSRRVEILWGKPPSKASYSMLDLKLIAISSIRYGHTGRTEDVGSMIDIDVQFGSPGEVVRYVPRAAQIAFLSPFPYHWFGKGTFGSTTFMRRISMFEMLLIYAALAFLPFALWQYRNRGEVWVLTTFCTSIMVVYALAVPNIGTLYRLRYGYLMPLVGLGILGGLMAWSALRGRRNLTDAPQPSGAD